VKESFHIRALGTGLLVGSNGEEKKGGTSFPFNCSTPFIRRYSGTFYLRPLGMARFHYLQRGGFFLSDHGIPCISGGCLFCSSAKKKKKRKDLRGEGESMIDSADKQKELKCGVEN